VSCRISLSNLQGRPKTELCLLPGERSTQSVCSLHMNNDIGKGSARGCAVQSAIACGAWPSWQYHCCQNKGRTRKYWSLPDLGSILSFTPWLMVSVGKHSRHAVKHLVVEAALAYLAVQGTRSSIRTNFSPRIRRRPCPISGGVDGAPHPCARLTPGDFRAQWAREGV